MEKLIFSINELPQIAKQLSNKLKDCQIITFQGPLGAGKTTLIKELLMHYGINKDEVISPTFTYMNIYTNSEGKNFYHFDLYRIKSVDDFLLAGFDEYLMDSNAICFIEWPEIIEPILKTKHLNVCKIAIDYAEDNKREISLKI